ncbi:hypothetical protein BGX20_011445 [Mortierella sp. AD010]|nr:hypothetical protein BGX20_011445 [Mortierella sp. AD010]
MTRKEFPKSGHFSIRLRYTDLVIDVKEGSPEPGAQIFLWKAKSEHNDNQNYVDGRLQNKKTGLVMNLPNLETFSIVDQQNVQDSTVQKFEYYDYTISVEHKDGLVLGVVGEKAPTAPIALIKRDDDSDLQQWEIVV